jgi:protein arginine N-methyltransferase 5
MFLLHVSSWNTFRLLCDHSVKLYVALELTADLPEQHILDRWLGEPVKVSI